MRLVWHDSVYRALFQGCIIVNGGYETMTKLVAKRAKANDQMPDLGKAINVFNTNSNVKNPFLRNSQESRSQSVEQAQVNESPSQPPNSPAQRE